LVFLPEIGSLRRIRQSKQVLYAENIDEVYGQGVRQPVPVDLVLRLDVEPVIRPELPGVAIGIFEYHILRQAGGFRLTFPYQRPPVPVYLAPRFRDLPFLKMNSLLNRASPCLWMTADTAKRLSGPPMRKLTNSSGRMACSRIRERFCEREKSFAMATPSCTFS